MEEKIKKRKRIAARICLVIIGLLYLATIILTFIDGELAKRLLTSCLIATVFVPALAWVYIWLYGVIANKKTIASVDFLEGEESKH